MNPVQLDAFFDEFGLSVYFFEEPNQWSNQWRVIFRIYRVLNSLFEGVELESEEGPVFRIPVYCADEVLKLEKGFRVLEKTFDAVGGWISWYLELL